MRWGKLGVAFLFYAIVVAIGLAVLLAYFFLDGFSYSGFIEYLTQLFDKPEWTVFFEQKLSKSRFLQTKNLLPYLALGYAIVVSPILFFKGKKVYSAFYDFIVFCWLGIKTTFTQFKNQEIFYKSSVMAILLFSLVKAYYFVFNWPIQFDEAWSYNYFIANGPLLAAITPHNNHILYTILAGASQWLPFEPLQNARFILPLFGLGASWLFFSLLLKKIGKWSALIGLALFAGSTVLTFYQLYARGYMLMIFFGIVVLWAVIEILKPNFNKKWLAIFCLGSVLGMYSVPSFLYWLAGISMALLVLLLVNKQWKTVLQFILSGLFAILGISILYAPFLISTGMDWLSNSIGARPNPLASLQYITMELGYFLTGLGKGSLVPYFILILLSALLLLAKTSKVRQWAFLIWVSFLMPFLAVFTQGWVEDRFFSYLVIPFALLLPLVLYSLLKKADSKKLNILIPIALLLFGTSAWLGYSHGFFNWSNNIDISVKNVSVEMQKEQIKEIYNFDFYSKPAIEYFYRAKNNSIRQIMSKPNSQDYKSFDVTRSYEAILWRKGEEVPYEIDENRYTKIFEDNYYLLLQLN